MPKQVDAAAVKHEIRSAARAVFGRRGVRGTGLTHIADAVGMGRSSLYHYYPDKSSLVSDIVRETLAQERAVFRECLRGPGGAIDRVQRLMDANVALFDAWAEIGRLTFELRLDDSKRFKRFFREIRGELAGVLREGQESGEVDPAIDPQMSAATLIGAIDGLLFQHFIDNRAFDAGTAREELRRHVTKVLAP